MYKSKLQELCHQRHWSLPKYSCMKDGPDHYPRFKASAYVNGVSFDSPANCASSKDAHNEAAKFAFLHFASPSSGSSMVSPEPIAEEPHREETYQSTEIHVNTSSVKDDLQYQYKNRLQNYAQRKNIKLPSYSCKSEGPPHALQHKVIVTIDGRTFESPESFSSLKEAEHAAAKAALMSLSPNDLQEDDSGFYKNLLQGLAQKEGFCLPIYKTVRFGEPHKPTFFSTVEVEGETFHGKGAKSKKQAERNAAKVAYNTFKERKLSQSGEFSSLGSSEGEAVKSTSSLDMIIPVDSHQNFKTGASLISTPTTTHKSQANTDEVQEVISAKNTSVIAKVSSQDCIPYPALLDVDKMAENGIAGSLLTSVPFSPKQDPSCSAMTTPLHLPAPSTADSNMEKTVEMQSYLLCNRIRIYSCFPDIAFPEGITVLPISDDKWVAVSLEFPNEKDKTTEF